MKLRTLEKKKLITTNNPEDDYINLLGDNFLYPEENVNFYKFTVTEKYEKRPDLLCHDIYNDSNMVDLLLKSNNISNPYFIKKGMILKIYENDKLLKNVKNSNPTESRIGDNNQVEDMIKKQYTRPENIKSKQRIDYLKEKFKSQNKSGEFLPPTFVKGNRSDILNQDNYVLYGTQKTTLNN